MRIASAKARSDIIPFYYAVIEPWQNLTTFEFINAS